MVSGDRFSSTEMYVLPKMCGLSKQVVFHGSGLKRGCTVHSQESYPISVSGRAYLCGVNGKVVVVGEMRILEVRIEDEECLWAARSNMVHDSAK